ARAHGARSGSAGCGESSRGARRPGPWLHGRRRATQVRDRRVQSNREGGASVTDVAAPTRRRSGARTRRATRTRARTPSSRGKAALPAYRQARALAPCRTSVEGAIGARGGDSPTWDAVAAAAALTAPGDADKPAMVAAARQILALTDARVGALVDATRDA